MKTKKRLAVVGGIALLLTIFAGSMVVEAWGPGGWFGRDSHRGGPGGWFHSGHGGGKEMGDFVLWRMDEKVKDLNLTAAQKEKYNKLRTSIKTHLAEAKDERKALREEIHTEMAKEVPDLEAMAPKLKTKIQEVSVTVQSNIDLAVAFYASLDSDQKKKVVSDIQERMAR